jgi:hypothetical protein
VGVHCGIYKNSYTNFFWYENCLNILENFQTSQIFFKIMVVLVVLRFEIQSLTLARKVLYQLVQTPSPFWFIYFSDTVMGSCLGPALGHHPPTSDSFVTEIIGMSYCAQFWNQNNILSFSWTALSLYYFL